MTGQVWAVNQLGGYLWAPNLDDQFRAALQPIPKFRQFARAMAAVGKKKGDTYNWDIFGNLANQGRIIAETEMTPETQFPIKQGTLTVTEMMNSVPYSGKLDTLSKVDLQRIINVQLSHDAGKTFDIYSFLQMKRTPLRVVPDAGTSTDAIELTTNGTATQTNNVAMRADHVSLIADQMRERNIIPYEGFPNDMYGCITHPSVLRPFKKDLQSLQQHTPEGFGWICYGAAGVFDKVVFIEQTHIPKGGAADSATFDALAGTADAWDNAKSSWAFFFGGDLLVEGVVIAEEIRGKLPGQYGRDHGIAWYYLGNFGLTRTEADDATAVMWDSAS